MGIVYLSALHFTASASVDLEPLGSHHLREMWNTNVFECRSCQLDILNNILVKLYRMVISCVTVLDLRGQLADFGPQDRDVQLERIEAYALFANIVAVRHEPIDASNLPINALPNCVQVAPQDVQSRNNIVCHK